MTLLQVYFPSRFLPWGQYHHQRNSYTLQGRQVILFSFIVFVIFSCFGEEGSSSWNYLSLGMDDVCTMLLMCQTNIAFSLGRITVISWGWKRRIDNVTSLDPTLLNIKTSPFMFREAFALSPSSFLIFRPSPWLTVTEAYIGTIPMYVYSHSHWDGISGDFHLTKEEMVKGCTLGKNKDDPIVLLLLLKAVMGFVEVIMSLEMREGHPSDVWAELKTKHA